MKCRFLLMGTAVLATLLLVTALNMSNIRAQETPEQPAPPQAAELATTPPAPEQPTSPPPAPETPAEPAPTPAAAPTEQAASMSQPPQVSEVVPKIPTPAKGFDFSPSMQFLAYNTYSQLAATQGDANFCFSPQLLAKQLTALRFGADGATASEILDVFPAKFPVPQTSEFLRLVEANAAKLPDKVNVSQQPPTFGSANAIWVPQDHPIIEQYISGAKAGLATELYAADFKNNRNIAATTVNAWVRDKTGGRLMSVFAEPYEVSLPGDISLVATGLVCASPRLAVPFHSKLSETGEFQLASGEKISVPMMRQVGQFYGAYDNNLQVLVMPCVEENLRFVILQPAPGRLATLEKAMTPQFLTQWFARLQPMTLDLVMPKLQTTSCLDLADTAKQLGMSTIASDKADFSNMSQAVEKGPLQLSKLMHETQFQLVEQAEAVQQPPQTQSRFYVNRPFVYLIWDAKDKVPLVIGRVTDPR